jgi:hypothetical protein
VSKIEHAVRNADRTDADLTDGEPEVTEERDDRT